jgi:hypothetical protein
VWTARSLAKSSFRRTGFGGESGQLHLEVFVVPADEAAALDEV